MLFFRYILFLTFFGCGVCSSVLASVTQFNLRDLGHGTAEISKYVGKSGSVFVPSVINGKKIVGIGDWAFAGNETLREIVLSAGIRYVGAGAFSNCVGLEFITFPYALEKIGDRAFFSCPKLASVRFTPLIETIGQEAFALCFRINPVDLSGRVRLGRNAFPKVEGEVVTKPASPFSDLVIPRIAQTNDFSKKYVLIIANEDYRRARMSSIDGALNDGRLFKEYCEKVLGIPSAHIQLCENATVGEMRYVIQRFIERGELAKKLGRAIDFIVYYAGHGVPVGRGDSSCLMPTDGSPSNPDEEFELNTLYHKFGNSGARQVCFFLDSCFSGLNRSGKGDSRIALPGAAKIVLPKNLSVFSAANSTQAAWGLKTVGNKRHGVFTYTLLKTLLDKEHHGKISYENLAKELSWNVLEAAAYDRHEQTSEAAFGSEFPKTSNLWEE